MTKLAQAVHQLELLDTLVTALAASNNELLRRLAERDDLTDGQMDLLNRWSLCCNELNDAAALYIERIAAAAH